MTYETVNQEQVLNLTVQLAHSATVRNLLKKFPTEKDDIMHAAIGISGEAGELLDAIKKHWAYGKQLDITNVVEELGDIEFYMEAMRQLLKLKREDILERNSYKLSQRYHKGKYSDEQAQQRADKPEEKPEAKVEPGPSEKVVADPATGFKRIVSLDPFSAEAQLLREYNARNDEIERNKV